jgi:hypothetical protein
VNAHPSRALHGDVDEHGDIVGALTRRVALAAADPTESRLSATFAPESPIDLDAHLHAIAAVVAHAKQRKYLA